MQKRQTIHDTFLEFFGRSPLLPHTMSNLGGHRGSLTTLLRSSLLFIGEIYQLICIHKQITFIVCSFLPGKPKKTICIAVTVLCFTSFNFYPHNTEQLFESIGIFLKCFFKSLLRLKACLSIGIKMV